MSYNLTKYTIGYMTKDKKGNDIINVFNAPYYQCNGILDNGCTITKGLVNDEAELYSRSMAMDLFCALMEQIENCDTENSGKKSEYFYEITQKQFEQLRNAEIYPVEIQATLKPPVKINDLI